MKISLTNLSFSYDKKPILRDLSLTLRPGDRIAVMAASGTGKTTLLHLLAGLLRPDGGSVTGIPHGKVGMLFQEDRLLPQLTVLDNLAFAAPRASRAERMEWLSRLGLAEEAQRLPEALSGGQRRRAAIARALSIQPKLLLLDEPFTGLDADSREQAARVILEAAQDAVLVAVTHHPHEAELLNAGILPLPQLRE